MAPDGGVLSLQDCLVSAEPEGNFRMVSGRVEVNMRRYFRAVRRLGSFTGPSPSRLHFAR